MESPMNGLFGKSYPFVVPNSNFKMGKNQFITLLCFMPMLLEYSPVK